MKHVANHSVKDEEELFREILSPEMKDNPYAFVMSVFPWGEEGTPLEKEKPRTWQIETLKEITEHIQENKKRLARGEDPLTFKKAVASGRGIGKSTLVAWLNLWMLSCHLGSTSIVTANSESQLSSKTWPEIKKWHTLMVNSHWFEANVLSIRPMPWFQEIVANQLKIDTGYYYSQGQLWSEEKPDSFAGAHNSVGLLLIFDEASGIPKPIWTVSEGFFTEKTAYRFWLVFSNPRRNTGAFFECFHANRKFWKRRSIDSRTVEGTDKTVLNQIIEQYGEDSDEARIEVKGEFPNQSTMQFIGRDLVENAVLREIEDDPWAPLIMGVDPARYGDNDTIVRFRQGRNGRVIPPVVITHKDNMYVANVCAALIDKHQPDAVCIDVGNGTGVIDRLREMKYKVYEIWFGSTSPDPQWADMRTYLWAEMRAWLPGGAIDNHEDLKTDLVAPEKEYVRGSDVQKLESKDSMRHRGLSSPDHGDAFACTFFKKVARRDNKLSRSGNKSRTASGMDYKVFGD